MTVQGCLTKDVIARINRQFTVMILIKGLHEDEQQEYFIRIREETKLKQVVFVLYMNNGIVIYVSATCISIEMDINMFRNFA